MHSLIEIETVDLSLDVNADDNPVSNLNSEVPTDACDEALFTDGADHGPAPLQNAVAPDEIFEGAMSTMDQGVNTKDPESAFHEPDALSRNVQLSVGGTTATINHSEALPNDGFANMVHTKCAWARAFPTIFPPDCTNNNWVIMQDVTSSPHPRERPVAFHEWLVQQTWRSDGVPAAHPSFGLVTINHKR